MLNFTTNTVSVEDTTNMEEVTTGFLNLNKGSFLDLEKRAPGLTKVDAGLGWDPSEFGDTIDLDLSALLLDASGKLITKSANDVIFFNNPKQPGIWSHGDDLTGGSSEHDEDEDDETISVIFAELDPRVKRILFFVSIHEAVTKKQTFGMVKRPYVRLVNSDNDEELCRYTLDDDYATDTSVKFAELIKSDEGKWAFHAMGVGKRQNKEQVVLTYL